MDENDIIFTIVKTEEEGCLERAKRRAEKYLRAMVGWVLSVRPLKKGLVWKIHPHTTQPVKSTPHPNHYFCFSSLLSLLLLFKKKRIIIYYAWEYVNLLTRIYHSFENEHVCPFLLLLLFQIEPFIIISHACMDACYHDMDHGHHARSWYDH